MLSLFQLFPLTFVGLPPELSRTDRGSDGPKLLATADEVPVSRLAASEYYSRSFFIPAVRRDSNLTFIKDLVSVRYCIPGILHAQNVPYRAHSSIP